MFDNTMISLMFMVMLCFVGMLVMFLFVIRSLTAHASTVREYQRQQQTALADLERMIMDISFSLRQSRPGQPSSTEEALGMPAGADTSDLMRFLQADGVARLGQQFPPPTAPPAAPARPRQPGVVGQPGAAPSSAVSGLDLRLDPAPSAGKGRQPSPRSGGLTMRRDG